MQVGHPGLDQGVLAGPQARALDLTAAAVVELLDPVRVDATVQDELLQGDPGDLTAYRVEAGQQHRLRCLVHDEVDPRDLLERPDVAALPADDPTLHVIAWKMQRGDDGLRGLFGREPLHGRGDDHAGPLLALLPRAAFDVTHQDRRAPLGVPLDHPDQLHPGLRRGQVRGVLEDGTAFGLDLGQLGSATGERGVLGGQLPGAGLELAFRPVEPGFALDQPAFPTVEVERSLAGLVSLRLDREFGLLTARLYLRRGACGRLLRVVGDPGGLELGLGEDRVAMPVGLVPSGLSGDGGLLTNGVVPAAYGTGERAQKSQDRYADDQKYDLDDPRHQGTPFPDRQADRRSHGETAWS